MMKALIAALAVSLHSHVGAQTKAGAAKGSGALVAERQIVATESDAAKNFTLGRDNGKTLTVDLARTLPALSAQRFTVLSVSRNGVESVASRNLTVSAQGVVRWQDISPGNFGLWRIVVRAEDGTGRQRDIALPVDVKLPPETPTICENPARAWCAFLRERWAQEEAAGNLEDFYNNRDGGHANFPIAQFSRQLRALAGGHATLVSPWPTRNVVGNASVYYQGPFAANMERFHSFTNAEFDAKVRVYEANHVFWYPAHTDIFGSGDLFHFNAAYSNTTVGSSGSEMDEVERTFIVWAAFRPDVKMRLVERGLLAPITQMLLRRNRVDSVADYLTGAAHPSGMSDIPAANAERKLLELAQATNAITVRDIPPLARLRVVSEDFTGADRELLATNAWGVHRIWRREDAQREVVLSAEDSVDLNGRPLTYQWVVLRGSKLVKVEPVDPDGRSVRIVFNYPQRYQFEPLPPGGQTNWTTRVDVGLFAHNGVAHSPPALFTVFGLDGETRFYDLTGRMLWRKPTGRPDHARLK
ncbi:MAG: hypothetical protein H7125_18240 [Proteobacteria bacterium]|nr:hypothetical protein [Burkholderiales bacterium]